MTNKNKRALGVKIMAWALAIVMAGSAATLAITMILYAFGVH